MLVPFYERKGTRWRTYGGLLYGWFIENRAPHTDWAERTLELAVQAFPSDRWSMAAR